MIWWILAGLVWAWCIWRQLRLCKKIVWLRYDLGGKHWKWDSSPTNGDWLDCIYECGGPLILIPVLDLCVLATTYCTYCEYKQEYNHTYHPNEYWEEKKLKR